MPEIDENVTADKVTNWKPLLVWLGISGIGIFGVTSDQFSLDKGGNWLVLAMAIFGPIVSAVYLIAIARKWHPVYATSVAVKAVGWTIGVPIILGLGIWAISSTSDWFKTVPSWAVVIIVLLVILVFQRARD